MSRHLPHTDDPLDPAIAQELRDLEAALAGAPSADPILLALVQDVRADAPAPRDAFRRELDARAAGGFPAAGGPRAWAAGVQAWLRARHIGMVPALGVAATLLLALVVGISVLHDGASSGPATQASGAASSAQDSAAPSAPNELGTGVQTAPGAGKSAPSAALAPAPSPGPMQRGPVSGAIATPSFGRKVEQTTSLNLRTATTKLQEVADGVVRVTQAAGGVVQQSQVDATDTGGSASFTLSVPSGRAAATVKQLSALAHVASMSQGATDITGSFVSVVNRLSDARAERRALARALAKATTAAEIARLQRRIIANRALIASLKGQLASLRRRADTTTILVGVTADGAAVSPGGGGGWSPGDAARDALRVLEVAAGVLLISAAVALPILLLAIPALLGTRVARRRRREHALDAT